VRLRVSTRPLAVLCSALWVLLLAPWIGASSARADDRIVVRGNYFREDSTRVLAPIVSYQKDLPDERFSLGTEYMMDSISSASIGAGSAELGGDRVFTEIRHQASARASSRLGPWGLGGGFRYSTETDYRARNLSLGMSREFLQKTLNLSVSYSYEFDRIFRILRNLNVPNPWKSNVINEAGEPREGPTNLLQIHYLDLGYGHVWGKHLVGGVNVEGTWATGPQDNPYRKVRNGEAETHPLLRRRLAPSAWVLWTIPRAGLVLEPRYRWHIDDWDIRAHSIDMRVHVRVARHLRLRARYRFYTQSGAFFYLEDGSYPSTAQYRTADPKTWPFRTHTPGIQVTWELDGLARLRGLHWLERGWIEVTYNHVFRRTLEGEPDTRYGNARMGSLAFSLAY
jgi:hypothetical protein